MVSCVAEYMRWQVTGVGSNYVLKAVVGEGSRIEHYGCELWAGTV